MDAILTRSGGQTVSQNDPYSNAIIRIKTNEDVTVTCNDGETTRTKICDSKGYVEFPVEYGTYTVSVNGNSKQIIVNALKIYEYEMYIRHTYGIKIDTTNEDPAGAVTYTDDAVGFTPLSVDQSTGICNYGSWDETTFMKEFLGCKPCLYKDGEVVGYLNPNDYSKFEDGTAADITSGNSGDVMIEFKKCWYKFSKTGSNIYFQIADYDRSSDGFVTTAFRSMNNGEDVDKMYYGAYEGYKLSDKWRSISGKTCTKSISYTNTRNYCKANGDKYSMEDYSKRWYILGLLMLVTKGRDMSSTIGQGRWQQKSALQTGTMNTKGLFYGKSIYTEGVKCFGIENMWGNYWNLIDGAITLSNTILGFKDAAPYNNTGSGYTSVADGMTRGISIHAVTDMMPILDGAAMTPTTGNSDDTKGWADGWYAPSSSTVCAAEVGGSFNLTVSSIYCLGPFNFHFAVGPSEAMDNIVGRVIAA